MDNQSSQTIETAQAFIGAEYDHGLDLGNLPPAPWSKSALGLALLQKLATVAGVGDIPRGQRDPSIDPRSFGFSRAKRIIRLLNLHRPCDEIEDERLRRARCAEIFAEGERIQAALNAMLGPITGTPRNPRAPKLRPARTTVKERGPRPSTWTS
jgi:hypothetical protein